MIIRCPIVQPQVASSLQTWSSHVYCMHRDDHRARNISAKARHTSGPHGSRAGEEATKVRVWPDLGLIRPTLVDFDQIRAMLDHCWPTFGQRQSISANTVSRSECGRECREAPDACRARPKRQPPAPRRARNVRRATIIPRGRNMCRSARSRRRPTSSPTVATTMEISPGSPAGSQHPSSILAQRVVLVGHEPQMSDQTRLLQIACEAAPLE